MRQAGGPRARSVAKLRVLARPCHRPIAAPTRRRPPPQHRPARAVRATGRDYVRDSPERDEPFPAAMAAHPSEHLPVGARQLGRRRQPRHRPHPHRSGVVHSPPRHPRGWRRAPRTAHVVPLPRSVHQTPAPYSDLAPPPCTDRGCAAQSAPEPFIEFGPRVRSGTRGTSASVRRLVAQLTNVSRPGEMNPSRSASGTAACIIDADRSDRSHECVRRCLRKRHRLWRSNVEAKARHLNGVTVVGGRHGNVRPEGNLPCAVGVHDDGV